MMGLVSIIALIWSDRVSDKYDEIVKAELDKMRIALEIGSSARSAVMSLKTYIRDVEDENRITFEDSITETTLNLNKYKKRNLSTTEKKYYQRLNKLFDQIQTIGRETADISDIQNKFLKEVTWKVSNVVEDVLDNHWGIELQERIPLDHEKLNALMEVEINFHELASAVQEYLLNAKESTKEKILDSEGDLKYWLGVLSETELTAQEKVWLEEISRINDEVNDKSNFIVDYEDSKNINIERVLNLSSDLDKIVEEEVKLGAERDIESAEYDLERNKVLASTLTLIALLLSGFGSWFYSSKYILNPVRKLKRAADHISKGEIDVEVDIIGSDELSDLSKSFSTLARNTKKQAELARQLGTGDFSIEVIPKSDKDILGNALMELKKNLESFDQEIKEKMWSKTQVANLINLTQDTQNIHQLLSSVINEMANVLEAGYGAIFVNDKTAKGDIVKYKLQASYAYKERKGLSNEFKVGEGVIGQCALEKQIIIISDIPDNYVKITSGLGESKPDIIIAIPIKYQEKVLGVMEFALFGELSESKKDIIEEFSKTLGVNINNLESHVETQRLLKESKELADELQAQQEELRLTNDELNAKTRVLRDSEEELKTQSEELQAANEELEEKTERLEQRNRDIDKKNKEIEKAKEEVEQRARDLALASKYKSEFLANMSHELRTPLNSLLILSKSLSQNKKGNLDSQQVEAATVINKGGQDLLRLINDILDLSKVEAGKLHVDVHQFSLKNMINEIQQQFEPIVQEKGIKLNISFDGHVNELIQTDEQRLSQILKNLFSNAIKFTSEGSVSLFVEQDKINSDMINFRVIDTGIGIPSAKQKEIFEAFQQADGSTSRKYGGTGLGLAISKAMAELLGGTITIYSEEGKGSTFTLSIKSKHQGFSNDESGQEFIPPNIDMNVTHNQSPVPIITDSSQDIVKNESQSIPKDDRNKRNQKSILIIEDDSDFRNILVQSAREKGFKTLSAPDGATGLLLAKKECPKAIILDLGLPDMDGKKVLEKIKQDEALCNIPVHIISGREQDSDMFQKGAIGFLSKPATEESLQAAFEKIESFIDNKIQRILIIEDDPFNQLAIQTVIASNKVDFDTVTTAEDGYKNITHKQYDCIILDLNLPDYSGLELLKKCKASVSHMPPVIINTGGDLTEQEYQELQKFSSTIVVKGVDSSERLLDEISLFLHSVKSKIPEEVIEKPKMIVKSDEVLSGRKILLVDDDMRNVFALSSVLEDYGLEISIASNGKVALEKLNEIDDIDLVLMDIMMPVMDGYEAISKIRAQKKYETLPIVALTAKAMSGDKEKCLSSGASDYITKPVDENKLISMLKVWMQKL